MFELLWSPSSTMTKEKIDQFLLQLKLKMLADNPNKKLVSVRNPATDQLEAALVIFTNCTQATVDLKMLKSGHKQTEPISNINGLFSDEIALQSLFTTNWNQLQASEIVQTKSLVPLELVQTNVAQFWTSKEVDLFRTAKRSENLNLERANRHLRQKDWKQLVEEYYRTLHQDISRDNEASRR
jgi:hypothetical protein